jgi:hypothetical protein
VKENHLGDEEATTGRRRNLALEHGDKNHQDTGREATEDTTSQEHGQVAGTGLQSTSEDGNRRSEEKRALAAEAVTGPATDESTEKATARIGTIDTADDGVGVGITRRGRVRAEAEVEIPRWLANGRRSDTETVAVGKTAQAEGEDDLRS